MVGTHHRGGWKHYCLRKPEEGGGGATEGGRSGGQGERKRAGNAIRRVNGTAGNDETGVTVCRRWIRRTSAVAGVDKVTPATNRGFRHGPGLLLDSARS